jgi:hypothetical protein
MFPMFKKKYNQILCTKLLSETTQVCTKKDNVAKTRPIYLTYIPGSGAVARNATFLGHNGPPMWPNVSQAKPNMHPTCPPGPAFYYCTVVFRCHSSGTVANTFDEAHLSGF